MTTSSLWCERAIVGGQAAERVALTVTDGRFSAVDVGVDAPAGSTVLAGLSMPGFANAHSHAFHRALRSRTQAGRGSFWTWRDAMYRAAERLDPELYHHLARAVFAEMAMAGVTTVGEFHYLHHQPDGTPYDDANAMGHAMLAAAADAGVRVTLLDTLYLHGGLGPHGHAPAEGVQRRYRDRSVDDWAQRVDDLPTTEGARIGAAVHSVRAVDPVSMASVRDWAAGRDAPVHAHVSEQREENEQCCAHYGRTPTEVLADAGLLGDHFTAVHATHLTDTDVERHAASAATVCFCPTTERDLGDGIGPSRELVDAGVSMSLGTDSHAMIDMFEEARAVELDERLRSTARGFHSASSLLEMMTINGHRSLGWSDVGEFAVGRRADLVTISLDSVRTAGTTAEFAAETAVFVATAADVVRVIVDGETIVDDGQHTRVDVARELTASIAAVMES